MKISLYVCVRIKRIPWKFCFLNPYNLPVKFVNFLKSRLIFMLLYCFWMFVNKLFSISRGHISKHNRWFSVKSWTYYFYVKTKMLTNFQICITCILLTSFYPLLFVQSLASFKALLSRLSFLPPNTIYLNLKLESLTL